MVGEGKSETMQMTPQTSTRKTMPRIMKMFIETSLRPTQTPMLNLRRGWCQPGTAGIYPSDVTTHGVVSGNSACRRLQADQAWAGCVLPCGLLGGLQRDFRCARWQASYLSEINSDPEGSAMKRVCSAVCCVVL